MFLINIEFFIENGRVLIPFLFAILEIFFADLYQLLYNHFFKFCKNVPSLLQFQEYFLFFRFEFLNNIIIKKVNFICSKEVPVTQT